MSDSLWPLIIATGAFVGGHIGLSSTPLRATLVARLGEGRFVGLYSAFVTVLFIVMLLAYGRAPGDVVLWYEVPGLRWATLVLMLPAAILLVIGLTAKNPTAVMQAEQAGDETVGAGPLAVTRHPMMWAIGLWAIAHLLVNGDAPSVIMMGGLGFLALFGTVLIDRKRAAKGGAAWQAFAARTSNVPPAAILSGRNALSLAAIGWWRIAVGVVLFIGLLAIHPWLFAASPLPVTAT